MSTRHLVDPQLAPILDVLPATSFAGQALAEIRGRADAAACAMMQADDATVTLDRHVVRSDGGDVRILVYRATDATAAAPALLHFHGGGFVMGTAELGDARCRAWARAIRGVVISVDYRLAPENAYPAALDDGVAALRWLHDRAGELDVDAGRIAVSGDSAGGGLAAALCLRMRDESGPAIAFQLLIYPMLDDRTGTLPARDPARGTGEFVWTAEANAFAWASLLGRAPGGDDIPHLAAPARAADLSGLPPAMIATAGLDLFVDEDVSYAMRLMASGVPTELYVAPGAYHGFDTMVPAASISRDFDRLCRDALRRGLAVAD